MPRYNLKFHNFWYILLVLKEFTAMTTSIQRYSQKQLIPNQTTVLIILLKLPNLYSVHVFIYVNFVILHIMKQCNDGTVNSSPDKGQ